MNSFDVVTIILTFVFGGIGGVLIRGYDGEIGSGIAGFLLFVLMTVVAMFIIAVFGAVFADRFEQITEIPIIIEKINKDDLSVIIKEKDERWIVDSKKYVLTKNDKSYKEIIKTKLKSNFIFSFMENVGEDQCIHISIKEFKELTK